MVSSDVLRKAGAARGIYIPLNDHGVIRVTRNQLRATIDLIEDLSIVILGMEGLRAEGVNLFPLVDFIADLGGIAGAWEQRVHLSATAATQIVAEWGSGPDIVEFTLDGLVPMSAAP